MEKSLSKNIVIGVLLVIVSWFVFIWFSIPKITDLYVGDPEFSFSDSGNIVSVDGAWLPPIINSGKSPNGVLLTNSHITCDSAKNICQESRAIIGRLIGGNELNMRTLIVEYSVNEWGNEFIVASLNYPVRIDELRINRRKKSAILIQTEKNSDTAASQPFIWELVDTNSAMRRFKELYN